MPIRLASTEDIKIKHKKHTAGNKLLEFNMKLEKYRSAGVFIYTHFGSSAGDFRVLAEILYWVSKKIKDCLQMSDRICLRHTELQINPIPSSLFTLNEGKCGSEPGKIRHSLSSQPIPITLRIYIDIQN
jgi:hypothetical protein